MKHIGGAEAGAMAKGDLVADLATALHENGDPDNPVYVAKQHLMPVIVPFVAEWMESPRTESLEGQTLAAIWREDMA